MGIIIIYVTYKSIDEARAVAAVLLNKKLVACANIFPAESHYRWKDNIEADREFVSVLKTRAENWNAIKKEIEKSHSYDVPCIMKINAEANEGFERWVYDETVGRKDLK